MKKLIILAVAILLLSFTGNETKKHYYSNGKQKDQVEMENGMFNGSFTSWYYNGKKKAEGTFKNNQRTGKWTDYDSLGNLRMIREYENAFTFKTIFAKNDKGLAVILPEKVNYVLVRNKDGFYEYPELKEKDIVFSRRNWRTIESNSTNSILFENNKVFELIRKSISETKKPVAYTTYDFKNSYNVDSIKNKINEQTFDVVRYKISEVYFFNSSWQLSETRIIGICPVIKDKTSGKESELFWIYYPEFRSILAAEKLTVKDEAFITNLEDVFFFRYFSSSIYNEEDKYDIAISELNNRTAIKKVAEKTEMDLFDIEHDLWISLTEKK